ncbi:MAG: hypothetical protein GXW91_06750 [Clostridiales bacterium]|nr:hypothetical protein [Clostridiales bacterium]
MNRRKSNKKIIIIFSCIGVLFIIAFTSLFLISGIFEQPEYLKPWQKTYSQKFDDPRVRLVSHGLLSSNGHNMQPWKIKLDKNNPMIFYLYTDSRRLTPEVDPNARQMMVTQGTFLEYLKIAGDKLGYQTTIHLFPEGDYNEQELSESMKTKPAAKIILTKTNSQNDPLYNFMFLPDTNREKYLPTRLTSGQIMKLENVNMDSDISIKIFQDKKNTGKLNDYAMQGADTEAGVNRVMTESENIFRSNEYQKNKYRYGFSMEGQGTSGIMMHLMQGLVTVFPSMNSGKASSDRFIQSTRTSVENTPAYAMIITGDNSRSSQVRSGMLYSKLILTAHQLGLTAQPLSQVLEEYPEMKNPYSSIHHDYAPNGKTIQMLFRLGRPSKEVPQSMRRDVMDLIIQE